MADEGVSLHDVAANTARADLRLNALDDSSGASGFAQRAMKGQFQRAANAPMSGGQLGTFAASAPAEAPAFTDATREAKAAQQNVRNVGSRTFFRRDGQWVDSQVTKAQETKAQRIKQFSNEYFELARSQGGRLSQYLVFDEPVLLNLNNQTYLIEP
jgi:hypothetical protein